MQPIAPAPVGPMRSRGAVAVMVSAVVLLSSLLMFGSGLFAAVGDRAPLQGPAVFHQSALSRPFDFPMPEELYHVPPPPFRAGAGAGGGDFTRRMRVLITGGAGFIGSQLGYNLHQLGHEVVLLDNMMFGYWDNLEVAGRKFGRFVRADVLDPRIEPYFEGVDVVFHFAALSALPVCQSHPRDAMSINVGGVANVLEAARKAGVGRFIFASTSAVYETNTEAVLDETLPVAPHLLYSLSKYQAELLVRGVAATNGLDVVVLRFFNVYGPHQDFRRKSPPFTSYLIRELISGRVPVLHSDGTQKRDYVHVDDLMRLATTCMTHPAARGQTFNVASGEPISVNDIYAIVAAALNSTVRPEYRPADRFWDAYPQLFAGKRPIARAILEKEVTKRTVGSFARAQRVVGWAPRVSMKDGLREMVRYVLKSQRMAGGGSGGAAGNKIEKAW